MRAGLLNKYITIETPTEAQNSVGQPIKTWATHAQVWAAIQPLRMQELVAAQQINGKATVKIRIRALDTVTEKMRVSWNGKIYNIEGPPLNMFERDREMHLMCSEGVNDG